jgi:transcription-repair coupling factor (superfamily II helicase)
VIEVGIDIPNANTIIVVDSELFGISTLYQLKGRIGRSNRQGFAYFMTSTDSLSNQTLSRLQLLRNHTALGSGIKMAEGDLDNRGFGTIFGNFQQGKCEEGTDYSFRVLQHKLADIQKHLVIPGNCFEFVV